MAVTAHDIEIELKARGMEHLIRPGWPEELAAWANEPD